MTLKNKKELPKGFIFRSALKANCEYDAMFGDQIVLRFIDYDNLKLKPAEAYMLADKLKEMADAIEENHTEHNVYTFCKTITK